MRFEKKNLPNTKIRIKAKWVLGAGYFILIFMISYLYASRSSGTTNVDYVGDFYQMSEFSFVTVCCLLLVTLYNSIHSQHIALAPSARDALDLVSNADCWCAIFGSNVKLEYDVISEPGLYLTLI